MLIFSKFPINSSQISWILTELVVYRDPFFRIFGIYQRMYLYLYICKFLHFLRMEGKHMSSVGNTPLLVTWPVHLRWIWPCFFEIRNSRFFQILRFWDALFWQHFFEVCFLSLISTRSRWVVANREERIQKFIENAFFGRSKLTRCRCIFLL